MTTTVPRIPVLAGQVWCGEEHRSIPVAECRDCELRYGFAVDADGVTVVVCGSPESVPGPLIAQQVAVGPADPRPPLG